MQVRLRRVAGIAHFAQELPRDDLLSDVDSESAGLHVGEVHAVTVAEDDDVVPARSIFAVRIQRLRLDRVFSLAITSPAHGATTSAPKAEYLSRSCGKKPDALSPRAFSFTISSA